MGIVSAKQKGGPIEKTDTLSGNDYPKLFDGTPNPRHYCLSTSRNYPSVVGNLPAELLRTHFTSGFGRNPNGQH